MSRPPTARPRVWVASELYYPEETSTGYYLTKIAEGLAGHFDVHVLCSQPTYSARGQRAAARETRNGVEIRRVRGTVLDKNKLLLRLVNVVTIAAAVFAAAIGGFRRGDAVLVVTNPPLLPFVVWLAASLRGARCVLLIHDVYPEALVASGLVSSAGIIDRGLGFLVRRLYRSMDTIVVIGHDMERRVRHRLGDSDVPIVLIPNWADVDEIVPLDRRRSIVLDDLGLADTFVVQYSGNVGRSHALEDLVDAATTLRDNAAIHFLFVGSGAKWAWLTAEVERRGLTNVTLRERYPRLRLAELLAACDLATVALHRGMAGISLPSRIYNIMAAGRPLLAVVDRDSDVAAMVGDEMGWVVSPGDAGGVVQALVAASSDPAGCRTRGARARRYAELSCRFERVRDAYVRLFQSMAEPRVR